MPTRRNVLPSPPVIRHIAALWTLWDHPSAAKDWPIERKLAEVKAAGFDGIATLPGKKDGALARDLGLSVVGYMASSKASEFGSLIRQNLDGGAVHINVQLADHDTKVEEATRLAVRVVELGESMGAKCSVEIHRDTCTETPEKFEAIAAGFKKATGRLMPVTWDYSHFAVVKHLSPPYSGRLLLQPKLIQRSQQFHFRPFNGHHCQIPVTDGRGQLSLEFKQWIPFLEDTLTLWMKGNQAGRDVMVVPELGPVRGGYNLAQLPSSWEDAKRLRGIIDLAWKKALKATRD